MTRDNLKVNTGSLTENALGFALGRSVNMLGGLTVNCSATITETLAVATDLTCGTFTCKTLYGGAVSQIKINAVYKPTITGNAAIGGNSTVTGNTTFTGTASGIPIGSATQAALDLKANTADAYDKTDADANLVVKANKFGPNFIGV